MCKLTSASRVLNRASIVALLAAILVLTISAGVYFISGIEMLWLANAGMIISIGAFILFMAFVSVVAAMWIKDSRETDDDCNLEVSV